MPDTAQAPSILSFPYAATSAPPELYRIPRWYACRTRARAEKQVDRLFGQARLECYLPLVEHVRQWADRKKRVGFPLFPGYVFAHFTLSKIHDILRTPGVVTIVRVNGYPTPIQEEELESIRRLVDGVNSTGLMPAPSDYLEVGQEVVVVDGPFRGMRGVLVEVRGTARVTVRLSAIRQAVSVEMDRKLLRPVRM
ncbi:MAG: UpxY family transcription antiterminator [Candidatus Rokubacteria bacterium]|nr:UpxY family transcription antiterminator [Candidatus Rokubacteria bacterium]